MKPSLLKSLIAACALAGMTTAALAHGSTKPKHGGMVQMSGETVIELVLGAKGADVYLTEEDEPLVASQFNAKLIQTAAGKKSEAMLKAAGGNRLSAPGFKAAKGAKLVVTLIDKSGAKSFATFVAK